MNAPTKFQIITGDDGKPAFVVLPYDEYMRVYQKEKNLIPNAVIGATVDGAPPIRAWREYLNLTQVEVAQRLGITQPAYAKQENSGKMRRATKEKIAAALGISIEQLDF